MHSTLKTLFPVLTPSASDTFADVRLYGGAVSRKGDDVVGREGQADKSFLDMEKWWVWCSCVFNVEAQQVSHLKERCDLSAGLLPKPSQARPIKHVGSGLHNILSHVQEHHQFGRGGVKENMA